MKSSGKGENRNNLRSCPGKQIPSSLIKRNETAKRRDIRCLFIYKIAYLALIFCSFIFENSGNYPARLMVYDCEPKMGELADEKCFLEAVTQ